MPVGWCRGEVKYNLSLSGVPRRGCQLTKQIFGWVRPGKGSMLPQAARGAACHGGPGGFEFSLFGGRGLRVGACPWWRKDAALGACAPCQWVPSGSGQAAGRCTVPVAPMPGPRLSGGWALRLAAAGGQVTSSCQWPRAPPALSELEPASGPAGPGPGCQCANWAAVGASLDRKRRC